jgi:hypothetical protein
MSRKKIEGFGGRYSITTKAKVWCSRKKRHVAISFYQGRLSVRLVDEKGQQSSYSLPKLMAKTYLGMPEKGQKIGFKDGNFQNVHIDNLFWKSREVKQKPPIKKAVKSIRAKKYRRNKVYKLYFGICNVFEDEVQIVLPQCLNSESEYHKAINEKDTYKSNVAFFKALCAGNI